jgi:hypothetical protein
MIIGQYINMLGYKYNTLEEAQASLEIVNTYFGLPCGDDCLRWTDIEEGNGFWYMSADRLDEVLGEPVEIEIETEI